MIIDKCVERYAYKLDFMTKSGEVIDPCVGLDFDEGRWDLTNWLCDVYGIDGVDDCLFDFGSDVDCCCKDCQ